MIGAMTGLRGALANLGYSVCDQTIGADHTQREGEARIEVAMPHIIVKLYSGRSDKQKAELAEEITKAVVLRRQLQNAIATNKGWAEFIAAAKSAHNERWFPLSRVARYAAAQLPPDELTLEAWRSPLSFDPIPYWEKVSCPVLAIYGELDKNTPTARNVPPLVAALKRGGNRDYTIIILPRTDHHFYENEAESRGYTAEIPAMQRFAPGYIDRMMTWISQRARN